MVQARAISEKEIAALEAQGRKIKGRKEYRRLQSVLLRAKEGKTAEEIAVILGINARTVEKHHLRYFEEGLQSFDVRKPGPKGPKLMSADAAKALFAKLESQAMQGSILNGLQVK